ncbi:MAG: tRNA (adenosine(37)-N6)-threonylcarbamoyltransferase complex ATPase subunit type 1 TsaE [Thermodesulfobacteriota bacterium]
MGLTLELIGPEETFRLGEILGRRLWAGSLLALSGPLGAGKTCLTQGVAAGLEVPENTPVVSPTFTLANEYQGLRMLFHLDAYRLSAEEFGESGLDEYFGREGVTVIEWADRVAGFLPEERLDLELSFSEPAGRRARLEPRGPAYEELTAEIRETWGR